MSRIAYITDTHIGCNENGFQQQPRYIAGFEVLAERLRQWLKRERIELLVHGGDVVDQGTQSQVKMGAQFLASLEVPCAVSLGNHDLSEHGSLALWKRFAPKEIGNVEETWRVSLEACDVFLLSHHWRAEHDFYWAAKEPQLPRIDTLQEEHLIASMQASGRPAILASHAPANAVPPEQTGLEKPYHEPNEQYLETLRRIAVACPNLRLILGGHNHAHSVFDHGAFISCTTSAFTEHPGQLRLLEITGDKISVDTIPLAAAAGLSEELIPEKKWALGGLAQRRYNVPLS